MTDTSSIRPGFGTQWQPFDEAELRTVSAEELARILEAHELYARSDKREGARANLDAVELRGRNFVRRALWRVRMSRADLTGANLEGAELSGVRFLNCAQLQTAQDWQAAFRDEELGCGAPIPAREV